MESQVFNVPLLPMNEAAPNKTGGPVGRIKRVVNGEWRKYEGKGGVQRVRVEKRNGFTQFPTTVRNPLTSAIISKAMTSPTAMGTLANRLVIFASAAAFVLSETAGCFESPDAHCPTQTLRATPISAKGSDSTDQIIRDDSTRIGSRTFRTWHDIGNGAVMISLVDDDGTVLMVPRNIAGLNGGQSKVSTDGTNFWVVYDNGGSSQIVVTAYDINGVFIGQDVSETASTAYFDVAPRLDGTPGVLVIQKNTAANAIDFYAFTVTGGAVIRSFVQVLIGGGIGLSTGRLAFLRNDSGDGMYYVAMVDGAGPFDYHVFQFTGGPVIAIGHHYIVATAQAAEPSEATGYVAATGAKDITVIFSFPDTATLPGPFAYRNFSRIYTATFAGVSTLAREQLSLTVVSRPFVMNGTYYVVMFYQADPGAAYTLTQSTYFLLNLAPINNYQVCGRWDNGTAYADWQAPGSDSQFFHLSTPTVAPNGGIHISLMYRVRSFTARSVQPTASNPGASVGIWTNVPVASIGMRDYSFGPDSGQTLEATGALFIPGAQCTTFTGNGFVEDGIPLIPELNVPIPGNIGGAVPGGTYSYVCGLEWTDDAGNRVLGPIGPPATATVNSGAGQNGVTLSGTNIHVSSKNGLRVGLYRSTIVNGIQSTSHFKITSDITPLYNSDGSVSWTYQDKATSIAIAVNEECYVDKGMLDRFPAPAHRGGCANADRTFLIGYDNAIWFSGPKTEGDAWWFSPVLRLPVPANEEITKCLLIDQFLVIYCATSSVFTVPISQLPDATGNNLVIPSPTLRPFSNGCNGQAVAMSDGIVYGSAQGGPWITSLGMQNAYFGEAIKDDAEQSGPIVSMTADKFQRIYMQLAGNGVTPVYDQITGQWYIWQMFETPVLLDTHKGLLAFVTASGHVWRQVPGSFADVDSAGAQHAIGRTISLARMHFGGIRNFQRTWNSQFEGEFLGAHSVSVTATYYQDDVDTPVTETFIIFVLDASQPYVYELQPMVEEMISVDYTFTETNPFGPTAGFALEAMAFEVGVDQMLGKLPPARRPTST